MQKTRLITATTSILLIALTGEMPAHAEEILIDNPFETKLFPMEEEKAEEEHPSPVKEEPLQASTEAVDTSPTASSIPDTKMSPEEQEADRKRKERIRQQRLKNRHMVQSDSLDKAIATVEATKDKESVTKDRGREQNKPRSLLESITSPKTNADPLHHEMRQPSRLFRLFFGAWRLQIANIALLRDSISDLIRLHPSCRIVPGEGMKTSDIIACSNPREFGAEGDEVIFEFLKANDVLTGAEFFFREERKAKNYARLIRREIEAHNSTFESVITDAVDSPLFMVSVQDAQGGFMVKISVHLRDAIEAFETYGRENIRSVSFGELEIGKTPLYDLKIDPEDCERMNDEGNSTVAEFYGQCFGFPYEAHYQLNLNAATNVVEMVAMTPIGVLTSNLVESALTKKYGEPKYCDRIESDVLLVRSNRIKKYHNSSKTDRLRPQKSTVFSGQCEQPIVFTAAERYVFVNNVLTPQRIEKDYLKRKADNELLRENKKELDRRKGRLDGFF